MELGLNWVDLIIIFTLIFFAFEALGRPLLIEVIDLLSFLAAFIASFKFYNLPAKFLETEFATPHGLSLALGFVAMWFISEIIFYFLVRLFLPKIPLIQLPGSKFFSILPATIRGLIFIALILVLTATIPIQPSIKKAVIDSKIGSQILRNAYALEQPLKQVFGAVTNDSLTFLTIKPRTDERINLGFVTTQFEIDQISEINMISLVNEERVKMGFKAMSFDQQLREVARLHSIDMFQRGYFAHISPEGKNVADRALENGVKFLTVGENLAFAPNLEPAHRGLMDSEGHRANILSSDFNKVGIGVIDGGIYGKMFTQVFSD